MVLGDLSQSRLDVAPDVFHLSFRPMHCEVEPVGGLPVAITLGETTSERTTSTRMDFLAEDSLPNQAIRHFGWQILGAVDRYVGSAIKQGNFNSS